MFNPTNSKPLTNRLLPFLACAEFSGTTIAEFFNNFDGTRKELTDLNCAVLAFIKLALDFAGYVALIMVLYGAFMYVTSYGDDSKAGSAKNTIIWAIIGLIVVASAQFIVNVLKKSL